MSRRGNNFSSEEVYASPVLTSAEQTGLSLTLRGDGRARRMRGSSSDEDTTQGELINEDFRAGGPNLPPVPCDTTSMSLDHPASILWKTDPSFIRQILDTLKKHDVQMKYLELFRRKSKKTYLDNNEWVPTIIVTAKRTKLDDSWLKACIDIRNILAQRSLDTLNIEIIDSRASAEIFTFSVLPSDSIFSRWSEVCTQILEIIGREGWLALECFRRGVNYERENNPVTIVLTIPYNSDKQWKPVREAIINVLDTLSLSQVAVSIVRGHIWRADGFDPVVLPDNAWEKPAQCGVSLGPFDSNRSSSTFGGFIELLSKKDEWDRFGLTCYHCTVEEKEESEMTQKEKNCRKHWSQKGITPDDQDKSLLKMSQPSVKDHQNRINVIDNDIHEFNNDPEIKKVQQQVEAGEFVIPNQQKWYGRRLSQQEARLKLKARAQEFFSSGRNYLGSVFAASGFRKTSDKPSSQLDWALIKVENSRESVNKIPPCGAASTSLAEFEDDRLQQPPERDPSPDQRLYKIGRTTGFTEGRLDGLQSVQLPTYKKDWSGNKILEETYEYTIAGMSGKQFSKRGDSGAIIFDDKCRTIGLLFAGNSETGATYYTPCPSLFEDIKKLTGAKDIRIPSD